MNTTPAIYPIRAYVFHKGKSPPLLTTTKSVPLSGGLKPSILHGQPFIWMATTNYYISPADSIALHLICRMEPAKDKITKVEQ